MRPFMCQVTLQLHWPQLWDGDDDIQCTHSYTTSCHALVAAGSIIVLHMHNHILQYKVMYCIVK